MTVPSRKDRLQAKQNHLYVSGSIESQTEEGAAGLKGGPSKATRYLADLLADEFFDFFDHLGEG
jgi:hypothetical protein